MGYIHHHTNTHHPFKPLAEEELIDVGITSQKPVCSKSDLIITCSSRLQTFNFSNRKEGKVTFLLCHF